MTPSNGTEHEKVHTEYAIYDNRDKCWWTCQSERRAKEKVEEFNEECPELAPHYYEERSKYTDDDRDGDDIQPVADGGTVDLEGLSTHDLVGMALGELGDQDADNGIPKQDVVKWVTSRTELGSADVHDAISWLEARGHVFEPRPDQLRRTDTEDDRWLAVAWHEALTDARVHAGDLDPKYLADRFDADTPDAVAKLVQQGVKEVIRSDNEMLTLDDLDEAEAKLEGSGFEVMTDGGQPTDADLSLREAVAPDYIKDAQRQWNSLSPEERHGSVEMARWVLEDAEYDEVREHDFYDESLQPSSDTEREWSFEEGDVIREEHEQFAPGGVELGKSEYKIKRRLIDESDEKRFYHVETQENGTHLYSNGAIEHSYKVIDPEESRVFGGDDDGIY